MDIDTNGRGIAQIDDDSDVVRGPCPKCGALVDSFPAYLGLGPIEVDGNEANHTPTLCSLRTTLARLTADLAAVTAERDMWRSECESITKERDEALADVAAATERAVKAEKERDEADSTASFVLRPEVAAFAMLMEEKLLLNDHRPGWKNDAVGALVARLYEEVRELVCAARDPRDRDPADRRDPAEIGREAADVANFAMMIADVCGGLNAGMLRAAAQRDAAYDEIAKLSRRFALALARPTIERDAP